MVKCNDERPSRRRVRNATISWVLLNSRVLECEFARGARSQDKSVRVGAVPMPGRAPALRHRPRAAARRRSPPRPPHMPQNTICGPTRKPPIRVMTYEVSFTQ